MEKTVIGQFDRNENERVFVSVGSYREKTYCDIRVFFNDPVYGDLKPTKKGITVSVELLPELVKLLNKTVNAVDAEAEADAEAMENIKNRSSHGGI